MHYVKANRASSVRVICAALRDFYAVLISAKFYGYTNPMTSEVRAAVAERHQGQIANHRTPDIAGIRGPFDEVGLRQETMPFLSRQIQDIDDASLIADQGRELGA